MLGRNWWGEMVDPRVILHFCSNENPGRAYCTYTPCPPPHGTGRNVEGAPTPSVHTKNVGQWRRSTLSIQTCLCAPFGAWSLRPESSVDATEIDVMCLPHPGQQLSHFHTGRQVQPSLVTDENPWGALDYGEWTMKRNHIGHRYKGSPLLLFSPPLFPFSPSLGNIHECGKLSFPWKHLSAQGLQMLFYANAFHPVLPGEMLFNPSAYPFSVFSGRERQRKRWKYFPDNCFHCFTLVEWKCNPAEVRSGCCGCILQGTKASVFNGGRREVREQAPEGQWSIHEKL